MTNWQLALLIFSSILSFLAFVGMISLLHDCVKIFPVVKVLVVKELKRIEDEEATARKAR